MRGVFFGVASALVIISFSERALAQTLADQLAPPAPREAEPAVPEPGERSITIDDAPAPASALPRRRRRRRFVRPQRLRRP